MFHIHSPDLRQQKYDMKLGLTFRFANRLFISFHKDVNDAVDVVKYVGG